MTARGFDYYDQMTAAAVRPSPAPTSPTPAATAAPQVTTATRGSDRLLRWSAYLLVFVGLLFLAALVVTVTPLGAIDADITIPFLAVFVGGLSAITWAALR